MQLPKLITTLRNEVVEDRRRLDRREARLLELARVLGLENPVDAPTAETRPDSTNGRRDVVIVPANRAYSFYHQYGAYVCQANRAFRAGLSRMGFYTRGVIQPEIPEIILRRQDVEWTEENAARLQATGDMGDEIIASLIETTIKLRDRQSGARHDVFLLTDADDERTLVLPHAIKHVGKGRGSAWTQRQRYVSLDKLRQNPHTTDEL